MRIYIVNSVNSIMICEHGDSLYTHQVGLDSQHLKVSNVWHSCIVISRSTETTVQRDAQLPDNLEPPSMLMHASF